MDLFDVLDKATTCVKFVITILSCVAFATRLRLSAAAQNGDGVVDREEFAGMTGADGELLTVVAQRMGTFEASLVRLFLLLCVGVASHHQQRHITFIFLCLNPGSGARHTVCPALRQNEMKLSQILSQRFIEDHQRTNEELRGELQAEKVRRGALTEPTCGPVAWVVPVSRGWVVGGLCAVYSPTLSQTLPTPPQQRPNLDETRLA